MFSHDGGWLAAAKAINAIGDYCRDQGVQLGFGRYAAVRQTESRYGIYDD